MTPLSLVLSADLYQRLIQHLLRPHSDDEEAAFLFTQVNRDTTGIQLSVRDFVLLTPSDFAFRTPQYLELTDETRRMLIKRAHDLGAGLVEVHSHPRFSAQFSWSDMRGLREFVPHVWWRLKGKPYLAIVVAPEGFDALAWVNDASVPQALDGLIVDSISKRSTGLSLPRWSEEKNDYVGKSF